MPAEGALTSVKEKLSPCMRRDCEAGGPGSGRPAPPAPGGL